MGKIPSRTPSLRAQKKGGKLKENYIGRLPPQLIKEGKGGNLHALRS